MMWVVQWERCGPSGLYTRRGLGEHDSGVGGVRQKWVVLDPAGPPRGARGEKATGFAPLRHGCERDVPSSGWLSSLLLFHFGDHTKWVWGIYLGALGWLGGRAGRIRFPSSFGWW